MTTTKWPKSAANPIGTFTIFDSVSPNENEAKEFANVKWSDLVARVHAPATAINKKALKLISYCAYGAILSVNGCIRHAANVVNVYGVEIDYDLEQMTLAQATQIMTDAAIACMLYTSPSHKDDKPRWRILLPLSCAHLPEQRKELVGRVNRLLGGVVSLESFTLSQSFYIGRVAGAPYDTSLVHGRTIDTADQLVPLYPITDSNPEGNESSPRDSKTDAELRDAFSRGVDRYQSILKLTTRWAVRGISVDDITSAIFALFDEATVSTKNKDGIDLRGRVKKMAESAVRKYGESRAPDAPLVEEILSGEADKQTIDPKDITEFVDGPPCLQHMAATEFTKGHHKAGLFAIAVYLKKRYPDNWEDYVEGYNSRWFTPPVAAGEVKALIRSLKKKDYNYSCKKMPLQPHCKQTLCRVRKFGVGQDEEWSVVIDPHAIRVTTEPPYWILTVNGLQMELEAKELQAQQLFVLRCMEVIREMPRKLPENEWRAQVNNIIRNATDQEAPQEASPRGELVELLRQFCTAFTQAETREEILTGKPFTEEGFTYFRAADFRKYLDAQKFRALTGSKLFAALRRHGVQHKQFWAGRANTHVWFVKSFDTPDVDIPPRTVNEAGGM